MTRQHIVILQLLLLLALAGTAHAADTAPAFTTAAVANFSVATGGSFTIAVDGAPAPALAIVSGLLPPGLGFSDNHDGSATLSGTPTAGSAGSYPLVVGATNSAGTAVQHLSLTVGGAWVTTRAPSDLRYNGDPYNVSYNANSRQLFPTQGTLNGLVNPNNDTCTVSFDYGPTTAYGSTLVYGDVSGAAPVAVSTHAYFSWIHDYFYDPVLHYRTKAVCATSGTWHGNDITFVPFTSTIRWYTDLGGPGPVNASFPTLNIHVFAACSDSPTMAAYDIFSNAGYTVNVEFGPGAFDHVILGDWQTASIFIPKAAGIAAFSYNYTLFNQTIVNEQSCAETPSPPAKIRAYALGLADTLAANGAEVFAIYNDNPAPVTLEVMAVADVFNVTLPAQSRQLIATGMGEMQLSHDATPFQVISPHSIFWADRYLVTALPVCTTATTNAFMLSNNGAAPQTAVLRSGSTEHRHDLAAYESRQVTVESGSWDLYLVVPGMAGPRMVGDHLKVATLASGGGTCGRTLTVEGNQSGGGYVTAAGCTLAWNGSSGSCSVADGASITLSSHPGSNGTFLGWSAGLGAAAACSGSADCTFTMHGDARLGWGIGDTTPDAFTFTAQNNAARSTVTPSNAITVAGIDSAAAISISGGEYSVSTDGGTNWSAWSTTTPATVSVNHQVKVRLTSSASYSTIVTATLTIGGVSAAFSVTTQGAPSYDPGTSTTTTPSVINAPSAANTTLTGTTPVNAALGSTLTIPAGANVSGVAITLAAPVAGVAVVPVTINVGGNILTVTPAGANVVVTLKTVTINGVATPVLAVSHGTLTVSAAAGQPLLTVSNNGMVVTAGVSGATVAFDGSGAAVLSVTSGYVVLPVNAFAEVNGNNFSACKDGKVYAGEIVQIDAAGKIPQVRLGSLTGSAVGDPLKAPSATGLTLNPAIPNLKGTVARLSATQDFTEVLAAALGATSKGQSGSGVLSLALPDGGNANVMPVGEITVDTNRADGVSVSGNGRKEVVKSGVIVNLAPAVSDIAQFAGKITAQDQNATVIVNDQGVIQVTAGGVTFGLQPGWNVSQGVGVAGFSVDNQGWLAYQDSVGILQTLYPVFIDLGQVVAALKTADASAGALGNADGTISARFQGATYTLLPDYFLVAVPAAHAKETYWVEDGRVYIKNSDGKTAQGFGVK